MAKRWGIVAAVAACLVVAATWWFWPREAPIDPVVAQARATQTKLMENFTTAPVKDQIQDMTKLRDQMQNMTREQRREVMEGPGGPRAFLRRDAEEFVKLPPEERAAFLDKRIDRMREMFSAMQAMGPPPGAGGRGDGPSGGGDGPRGGGDAPREGGSSRGTERQKEMLNRTSAEDRALFGEYFRALSERWQERGLPGGFGPR